MQTAHMTIGLAAVLSVGTASFAQDAPDPGYGKPAGTEVEAEERRSQPSFGNNTGISLAVPIGKVSVDPETLNGEPVYVRRMTIRAGMTIVEVSTTPFMPVSHSAEQPRGVRPDQPAPW